MTTYSISKHMTARLDRPVYLLLVWITSHLKHVAYVKHGPLYPSFVIAGLTGITLIVKRDPALITV